MGIEAVAWVVLGLTALVASFRAHRSRRARLTGRWAIAVLFVLAGALVNALYLASGVDYAAFADMSPWAFVRDTWASVVVPNQGVWIGLLIAFEAVAGGLVASGGRRAQVGYVAIIGFHVCLVAFGWGFLVWSAPMLLALVLLLRAERAALRDAGATAPAAPTASQTASVVPS